MSRILIIEAQSDIRRLIRWSLAPEPHEVHECSQVRAGLNAAFMLLPDLVICDVTLPDAGEGLEICARIRADAQLGHAAVLALADGVAERSRTAAQRAGADDFLSKPFSSDELRDAVVRLLALAARRREAA